MSGILTSHVLIDLGWRWRAIRGSKLAHLVPARLGHWSRSACLRLAVTEESDLEQPLGLLSEIPRCPSCSSYPRKP